MGDRWRSAVWPLAAWAVLMAALAGLQAVLGGRSLPVLLQTGAAVLCGVIALAIWLSRRLERRHLRCGLPVTGLSLPTVLAGVSLAATIDGTTVGSWLEIGGTLGLALAAGLLWRGRRILRRRRNRELGEARS